MAYKQVFLSHCVRSTGRHALALNEMLRDSGFSTFICVDMQPGDSFRESILGNAINCNIMVIFLDEAWNNSMECRSEFNSAYSCYNRTASPKVIPIVIGGFNWISPSEHLFAHCITSNFQCMLLQGEEQSDWREVFEKVVAKCRQILPQPTVAQDNPDSSSSSQSSSSATDEFQSVLMEFITCEICQEIMEDARRLPCNHSFCSQCLVEWKDKNPENDLTCPKCRIICHQSISSLPSDFKVNQLIEAYKTKQKNPQMPTAEAAKPVTSADQELQAWFETQGIPKEAQRILIEQGYDSVEIVLDLKREEVDEIPELKHGHRKKLIKVITESAPVAEASSNGTQTKGLLDCDDSILLEKIYDNRSLKSGTIPADTLKFWASFSEAQRKDFLDRVKKFGNAVKTNKTIPDKTKADKLHKVAMILCEGGLYGEAEAFAIDSLTFRKEETSKAYFETKVLLLYVVQSKLKSIKWIESETLSEWQSSLAHCSDTIKKGSKYLDNEMQCKTIIMKLFAIRAVKNRDKKYSVDSTTLSTFGAGMCKKVNDKSLLAEYLMTMALDDNKGTAQSCKAQVKKLLEARGVCQKACGEFSTLMSRIYHNLGSAFEGLNAFELAYECFRRVWIIERQLYGVHHPVAQKAASVMQEDKYRQLAEKLNDSLPTGDNLSDVSRDLNYELRLKPVLNYK